MVAKASGQNIDSVNNGKLRVEDGNNRLIVNDGTKDRLLLGEEDSGEIVVKLSQAGYDVKNATDAQLVLSSEFNNFKIVSKQTIVVSKGANSQAATTNYTHGLNFIPCVIGYVSTDSATFAGTWPVPWLQISYGAGLTIIGNFFVNVNSTRIQCGVNLPGSGSDYVAPLVATFTIYILAETSA